MTSYNYLQLVILISDSRVHDCMLSHQIQIFFPDVLFTVVLTRQGDKKFSDTGNREETIKKYISVYGNLFLLLQFTLHIEA